MVLLIAVFYGVPYLHGTDTSSQHDSVQQSSATANEAVQFDLSEMDPLYNFTMGISGQALFPIQNNADRMMISPGTHLIFNWNPKWVKFFFWRADAGITRIGMKHDRTAFLSYLSLGLYPSFHWNFTGDFGLYVNAGGGYRFATVKSEALRIQESEPVPFAKGVVGVEYAFEEVPLAIFGEASISVMYDPDRPITTIEAGVGVSYQFLDPAVQALRRKRLQVESVQIDNLFGALYAKYNELPIGTITIVNVSNRTLYNLRPDFFVAKYMDNPKEGKTIKELDPGERVELEINAVFNQQVLGITEDTILLGNLTIRYEDRGEEREQSVSKDFVLHNRNALTWTDTRKLGSFVTQNDEAVKTFSRGVVTLFKDADALLNERLMEAVEIFIGLGQYGIQYVADPQTPFSRFSQDEEAVDSINYPRETLRYKSGDCDDLVILYSALLESVGIPTAFVTVPGHIFMMFDTGVPASDYEEISKNINMIHTMGNTVWVPVEVTNVGKTFLEAWETASKQIGRWSGTDGLEIIPMTAAQKVFPPVALLPSDTQVILPRIDYIRAQVSEDFEKIEAQASIETIESLEAQLHDDPENVELMNQIGTRYARIEQWEQAIAIFKQAIVQKDDYFPAYLNLARAYLEVEKYPEAEEILYKCKALRPDDINVYLVFGVLYQKQAF